MTRKLAMIVAFREAGLKGLTGKELLAVGGENWRRRLRELEADGYVFNARRGRFSHGRPWRWVLVSEPTPVADVTVEELRLLDAPPAPPASALFEDVVA